MKLTFSLYWKLLWPVCLIDFFLVVVLPFLFPYLQGHLAFLNIVICVPLIWVLAYRGGAQMGRISTGIFAALIYALIWRFILSVLAASLLGIDYYSISISQLGYWVIGVLVIFFIGAPVVLLFSWPAAYLGRKRFIKRNDVLALNLKESQRPWISMIIMFYTRLVMILFVIYVVSNMYVNGSFDCSFTAWSLPSCFCKPGYGSFLAYSVIFLFFNVLLIFVDSILARKSFSSKTLFMLDMTLASPFWWLAGFAQAVVCSLSFFVRASMWLINGMSRPGKRGL